MPAFLKWSILLFLYLVPCILTLPTTTDLRLPGKAVGGIVLPRAGIQKATVPTSKLTGGLFWTVTANVNGQDVVIMVDTGSSDL